LEYTLDDGTGTGTTEVARVASGLVNFIVKPFAKDESNYGKKSCSPSPTTPFVDKDNPSLSGGYPDKFAECCHVSPGYLPTGTPKLPPPPAKCSGTPGRHCSQICKPYQQDKPVSKDPPCVQLDVMGIIPKDDVEAMSIAKCFIVTISRDPAPVCDSTRHKPITSYVLQFIAADGFYWGGFPDLPAVEAGKSQTDQNAMETLCTHTGKAKLYDTKDTSRTTEFCPKDNPFFIARVSVFSFRGIKISLIFNSLTVPVLACVSTGGGK